MSRKKHLSATASLACCLDFAARVLSSPASVQEICTKSALAPMVVEAHRFGQQMAKQIDPGTPADVRKLLRILQDDGSTEWKHESPLAGLAVADLTWDFEGTVAHTLEMELEELQDRATTASKETCVVLTAVSSIPGGGHTVIWFPNESGRDDDEARNIQRKSQILLYMCPGRVKVVKNVSDLTKKMHDELPSLRESGATYKVWAVTMDSSRTKQAASSVRKSESKSNQHEEESLPSCPVVKVSESVDNQQRSKLPSGFVDFDGNQQVVDLLPTGANESTDSISDHIRKQGSSPLASRRSSVCRGGQDAIQSHSIFSFGLPSVVTPSGSGEHKQRNLEAVESEVGDVRSEGSNTDEGGGTESPVRNQCLDVQPRRPIVSASLAGFLNEVPVQGDTARLGMNAQLQDGFPWQSCDGKVLRRVGRLQRATSTDDDEGAACALVDGASDGAQDGDVELQGEDESKELDEFHGVLDTKELEGQDATEDGGCARESNNSHGSDVPHPSEVQTAQPQSQQRRLRPLFDDTTRSTGDNGVPSSTIFTLIHAPSPPLTVTPSPTKMLPATDTSRGSGLADACEDVDDDTTSLRSSATETIAKLLEPSDDEKDAVKPTPVNYKDKLGARVWFELEYTARRLEREEILERQQQIRRRQGGNFANEGQTPATGNGEGSRRMTPTGWSKANRPTKHKALFSEGASNTQLPSAANVVLVPEPIQQEGLTKDASVLSLRQSESKSLEANESWPSSQERTYGRAEPTLPCEELSRAKTPKTLVSRVEGPEESSKRVEIAPPSVGQRLSRDRAHASAGSVQQDDQRSHNVGAELSHEQVDLIKSSESLREAYERRSSALNSHTGARVEPSAPDTRVPNSQPNSIQMGDEDECSVQMIQGETQAAVQATPTEDELPSTETASAVPFTVHGRVPIRTRRSSSRVIASASDESSSSRGTERSSFPYEANHDISTARSHPRKSSPGEASRIQAPRKLEAASAAPPVATFIALTDDRTSTSDNAAPTRQERLNDLRQKKLQKLQQTRDSSLRQQKEKNQQRQEHRPLSFVNSVYSKKASNRQLIQNALEFTLLAGGSMEKERALALQALAESTCDNFIVLLKSPKELKFRALYENHVERDCAVRIFSVLSRNSSRAPAKLGSSDVISQFFKYSSAKKQLLPVPTRSFTVKTDACALVDQLVFKGKSQTGTSALARLLY